MWNRNYEMLFARNITLSIPSAYTCLDIVVLTLRIL